MTKASEDDDQPVDPFQGPDWSPGTGSSDSAGTGSSDEPAVAPRSGRRVKVSRRRKRLLRRRRRIGLAMVVTGGLIVLAVIWLVITGLLARRELTRVRADVQTLRADISAGDLVSARKAAADLASHADRAHSLTSGPVWYLAAGLPAGGEPLRTVRGVTAAIDSLGTTALPDLVEASRAIDPSRLRRADGSIDLAPIEAVAPKLATASRAVAAANQTLAALPAQTWLSSVDQARRDAVRQFAALGNTVRTADLAAHIAPPMLGANGVRNYFISFETEAELRGTGGLPGAFAIMRADHGKISFVRFESDEALINVDSGLNLGADFDALYRGDNATSDYLDSNSSPHFPFAARIWTAMWAKKTGQHLDGALALDPTALSYLLQVTGPATLVNGAQVSAENVVSLTQQQVYGRFPIDRQDARKAFQLQIAKAISRHLIERAGRTRALLSAAGRAAGERRLLAWSSDPTIEGALMQTALGGAVVRTDAPYLGLAVNNAGANKLDYYLQAKVVWRREGCGDQRNVTVTITLRNDAPRKLPAYVYGFTGRRGFPQRPGDNRLIVHYLATAGAQVGLVQIDGRQGTRGVGREQGHPVFTLDLQMPRGKTRTIVVHLVEPATKGKPIVMPQPLVRPLQVSVQDARCG